MLFDWISVLLFVGAGYGLLLSLILLFARDKNSHKRIFGLLMVLFAFHLIEYGIFRSQGSFHNAVHLFGYRYPIRFCIGPLFLIYTLGLIRRTKLKRHHVFAHFIPAICSFLILLPLLTKPYDEKVKIFHHFSLLEEPYYYQLISVLAIFSVLSIIIYVAISLRKINIYRKVTSEYHSNEQEIWTSTFYRFTVIYFIVLSGYFMAVIHRVFVFQLFNASILFLLMSFLLMINVILLTLIVLRQNEVIPIELANLPQPAIEPLAQAILIGQEELETIDNIMTGKKLYLDANLTINDLAEELNMPAYIVSKQINNGYQNTFFKFVNQYRIDHAKDLLAHSNIKILAVALDSGFSHKSSFHRTFKRMVGMTPQEFRESAN